MTKSAGSAGAAADGRTLRWEHRKPELLAAATDYVLEAGVADLTLRPLGSAIGASITTLIRHFGSKENLVREVCQEILGETIEVFDQFWARSDGQPAEVLRGLWNLWLAPEYSRQFVFFFELYGLALREPEAYEWFADSVVHNWIAPLQRALTTHGIEPRRASTIATLFLGLVRGLYLDIAATDDVERVGAAYDLAMTLLEPALKADGA